MLYVRLPKALYGMLRAALIFYKKLRGDLEDMGFVINPYDPCVVNKEVDRLQMTVCWHVDDLKVSHKDEATVTAFAIKVLELYGPKNTISRGTVHDYLGMDLDFGTEPGTLIMSMIKYLQKIIDEFPEVLKGTRVNPGGDWLFKIRGDEGQEILTEEMARQFHHTTAQLLFLCKRARPDIETLVLFLTTRVKSPDTDDWKKLKQGLM